VATSESKLPRTLSIIESGTQRRLHLGGQVYVSMRGEVVADFAAGENKPGLSLSRDALMPWLSAGKPVTAVAIAQFWEKGALDLNDKVVRFIPEFGQGGKEPITIRHLLTHTAGFRSADLSLREDADWGEAIRRVCEAPLEPRWVIGAKAGYQLASSWYVLGEIIRRLDGRPFDRYLREMILEPLGMRDSWIGMSPDTFKAYGDRIGWIYTAEGGALEPHSVWNTESGCVGCRPGSNARGPIRELGRFYEWLLEACASPPNVSTRVLQPDTILALTGRVRAGMFDHTFRHVVDFGLGFIVDSNRYGRETVPYGYGRHCSDAAFGHGGSQCSCAFADPVHGLVVAWAFNGRPGEAAHQLRNRDLNSALYQDLGLTQ
jgi:CubicO group peptidase (beta-lactamase class C family)